MQQKNRHDDPCHPKDPFDKDKDMEVELILDDEDFQFNPRITYHKRLRGRLEICSFLAFESFIGKIFPLYDLTPG